MKLNQTNDGEDETELSIAKDDWGQLKQAYNFMNIYPRIILLLYVRCILYKKLWMKSLYLSCLRRREDDEDSRKSEPPATFLSTVVGINTVRK
jgi:hypothetical protein